MERREAERREAEWKAREKAREDKAEREYQRAIKAGGRVAAEAMWQRLFDETLDATGGRYELCQWEDEYTRIPASTAPPTSTARSTTGS